MNGTFRASSTIPFPPTVRVPDLDLSVPSSNPTHSASSREIASASGRKITAAIKTKRNEAMEKYLTIAKPRDYRFAQRIHGAAMGPLWSDVWTDDTAITTNPRASDMDRGIRAAVTEGLKANIKTVLKNMRDETEVESNEPSSKRQKPSLDIEYVQDIQKSVQKLIPKDTSKSRLSNQVLDLEQVAITRMRHFVRNQIRRGGRSSWSLYQVDQILDLELYQQDAHVLARSLRRDDLVYSTFGHLVGCMMSHSRVMNGRHSASILQIRMVENRMREALYECVTFLSDLNRPIAVDKIGQPDVKTLYAINGEPLVLVGRKGARVLYTNKTVRAGDQIQIGNTENSDGSTDSSAPPSPRSPQLEPAVIVSNPSLTLS